MTLRTACCVALVVLLGGCANDQVRRDADKLIAEGKTDEALVKLQTAAKEKPEDINIRAALSLRRDAAIYGWLDEANAAMAASNFDGAETHFKHVLQFEPTNRRALSGLEDIARARKSQVNVDRAQEAFKKGDWDKAIDFSQAVLENHPANKDALEVHEAAEDRLAFEAQDVPTLRSLYRKPVSVEFRDANLKMVFELLSKNTGINFILDKEVRSDLKATLFLKQAALEDAVDLLLSTNQLEKRILNQNSVLIYPSTPGKLKEYQDLIMKGFYLASADVKQVQGMIKSTLNAKNVNIDERLKLLVIRDTPETVRLAERIIAMQDISEPEVMLDVEVLEIKRTKLTELGVHFPDKLTLAPLASNGTALTLNDLKNLNSNRIGATISNTTINAQQEDGTVNLLANPRIRARNHEKAKILIGDKVPVITTTSTSTGFVSESVQYIDVGLKLEIEPDIYLHDDVAMKVALEVSTIVKEVRSSSGTLAYQLGTRNASSLLQLKDGETQILAGLINDEDRLTSNKVPGLGDLPLIGRLFSSNRNDRQKTEIVLSITPHLVRGIRRPQEALQGYWTGTDDRLRTRPLTLKAITPNRDEIASSATAAIASVAAPALASDMTNAAAEGPAVSLNWQGPAKVKVGEPFKVNLLLKSNEALRSLPTQIAFDPKVLQVVEVTEGDFFKKGGAKTLSNSNIDQSGGRIFAGIARSDAEGATGEASLLTVTFKALAVAPQSELRLISATPVSAGKKAVTPVLAPPLSLSVTN